MSSLDRFTCEETFRRLDDYLDRELGPDEMQLVSEHLALCAVCTEEFAFEASVIDGVKRKLRQIDAPDDLSSRVLELLQRDKASSS